MKMLVYTVLYALVNGAVLFGLMLPWKRELQEKEARLAKELSFEELFKSKPSDVSGLPLYFRLKDAVVKKEMAIQTTIKTAVSMRISGIRHRFITTHYALIPIVQKGESVAGSPVLVWLYFYKIRHHQGNPANYQDDYQIPWNLAEWKNAGSVLESKPFRYLQGKEVWESMLSKTYEKYNMIPVQPARLYFVSPVIKKVDWSTYNFLSKALLVLDGFAFLPILFSFAFYFINKP